MSTHGQAGGGRSGVEKKLIDYNVLCNRRNPGKNPRWKLRRKRVDHEDFLKNPPPKNPREIHQKSSRNPAAEQGLRHPEQIPPGWHRLSGSPQQSD
jgi:hypothetical protein